MQIKAKKQSAESLLPSEKQPEEWPESFSIGTETAYERGYAYPYKRQKIKEETVYVCDKGSDNAQHGEVLVLRREKEEWIAYDSLVSENELTCRQQVFRSRDADITKEGEHTWQMNKSRITGDEPIWFGALNCRTKVL